MAIMATPREAYDLWVAAANVYANNADAELSDEQYITLNEVLMPDVKVSDDQVLTHDIRTRDALLAYIAGNDMAATFARLIDDMGSTVAQAIIETAESVNADEAAKQQVLVENLAVAATMRGACYYLAGQYDEARECCEPHRGHYSLATLLCNGLDMQAPAELLQRSFTHYPIDTLLGE